MKKTPEAEARQKATKYVSKLNKEMTDLMSHMLSLKFQKDAASLYTATNERMF